MLYLFNIISFIVTILILWFKTDAFIDYCKLFNVFTQTVKNFNYSTSISFPQFLYVTYKNSMKNRFKLFLLKLVTCPLCLSLWLSVIFSILFGYFFCFPLFYISSLFIYFNLIKFID